MTQFDALMSDSLPEVEPKRFNLLIPAMLILSVVFAPAVIAMLVSFVYP